jgi:competence protein ComEC
MFIKPLPLRRGFLVLLTFAVFSTLYALFHKTEKADDYGPVKVKGEVIATSFRKVYLLSEEGKIYKLYLRKKVYPSDRLTVEGLAKGYRLTPNLVKVKRSILQRLRIKVHNLLKERFLKTARSRFEKKLGSALLFGENWFSYSERKKLSKIGIYHVIVISGLHYALLFTFFLIFPVRWKLRYILALGFLTFFTFLVLFPKAPAYRAFFSFALFLIAKILEEKYVSLKAWLFAYGLGLLLFPYWFYSVGFWLSYLASLALILYYGGNRTPEENFLKNIANGWFGIEASIVVLSVINPIIAYYFHFISFGGILYTALFTFLTEVFLIIGLLNMFTYWSFSPLLEIQHLIADLYGKLFYSIPEKVYIKAGSFPEVFMYVFVLLSLVVLLSPFKRKLLILLLLLAVQVLFFTV